MLRWHLYGRANLDPRMPGYNVPANPQHPAAVDDFQHPFGTRKTTSSSENQTKKEQS